MVKEKIKGWFVECETEMKRKEKDMLSKLEFFDSKTEMEDFSTTEMDIRLAIKVDLLNLYLLEERNLIQKSKLNWLKLGDENTKFFHRFLSAKRRRYMITELSSDSNMVLHSFRDIESEILGYFTDYTLKFQAPDSFQQVCLGSKSLFTEPCINSSISD